MKNKIKWRLRNLIPSQFHRISEEKSSIKFYSGHNIWYSNVNVSIEYVTKMVGLSSEWFTYLAIRLWSSLGQMFSNLIFSDTIAKCKQLVPIPRCHQNLLYCHHCCHHLCTMCSQFMVVELCLRLPNIYGAYYPKMCLCLPIHIIAKQNVQNIELIFANNEWE